MLLEPEIVRVLDFVLVDFVLVAPVAFSLVNAPDVHAVGLRFAAACRALTGAGKDVLGLAGHRESVAQTIRGWSGCPRQQPLSHTVNGSTLALRLHFSAIETTGYKVNG